MFVKIITAWSMDRMYPVDHVQECNRVFGKWVFDHGYGIVTDSAGDPIVDPLLIPSIVNGAILAPAPTVIVVAWDNNIAVTDKTGMVVNVNDVPVVITSVLAADNVLEVTLPAPVVFGDVIDFTYDGETGNVTNDPWTALAANGGSIIVRNDVPVVVVLGGAVPPPPVPDPVPSPFPLDP